MGISKELNRGRHCVSALHVHLVFITKYRYRVFDRDALDRLRLLFSKICTDFESQLTEMDGQDQHVHLLVRYPPKVAVSNMLKSYIKQQNAPSGRLKGPYIPGLKSGALRPHG